MFIARAGRASRPAIRRLQKGDDPALLHAEIVHADAGQFRELPPQQRAEPFDPRFDRVDAYPHRVIGRRLPRPIWPATKRL